MLPQPFPPGRALHLRAMKAARLGRAHALLEGGRARGQIVREAVWHVPVLARGNAEARPLGASRHHHLQPRLLLPQQFGQPGLGAFVAMHQAHQLRLALHAAHKVQQVLLIRMGGIAA